MKREELEKYLGKKVKIVLFDKEVIIGELHRTGEEQFKNDANLYLPNNRYFLINPQSCLFRCSHVIRLTEGDMPGCKNDDCFSCHLNCEIRQADCHCVEAPSGNPFSCTTLAAYENIKQDIGDACQFVKELVTQPEFPDMKNKQERKDFVDAYKTWDVWCRNDMTEEVFYRYDLPDDAAIVVKNYPYYLDWRDKECEERKLYLLKPGYKHFANCASTMTEIEKYLRDLRKKG